MDEDMLAIGGFFFTVIVVTLGFPLVRVTMSRSSRFAAPLSPVSR